MLLSSHSALNVERSLGSVGNPQVVEHAAFAQPVLLQYWQLALRWKWVFAGIIAAAFAMGLTLTLLATPQYIATSRIEISRDQKKITSIEGLDSQNSGRDLEFYQTQYSLLKARSLAERVSRQLRLSASENFFEAHGVKFQDDELFASKGSGEPLDQTERQRREKIAVDLLMTNISISPIRGSALIDISYESASPALSAEIASTWTNQFILQSMDRRFASTADARKFLEGRLADLRTRLEVSERDLVNYAEAKGIVALGKSKSTDGRTEVERTLVSSDLEALNSALTEATTERIAAESRAKLGVSGANTDSLNNVAIGQLRQKRAEVASEYAKLLVQFEPGYPVAKSLSEQLRNLDTSIAREESRVLSTRSTEYRAALKRETDLRNQVERLKGLMSRQQRDGIQYNIYQREADTNRELYDGLLQRYKEIGVAGIGANNIAIVDSAKIPEAPSSPNLVLNIALALLAGIGLAAAAIIALDQVDEGLRDPTQVNRLLQVPLLGSVPNSEGANALALLNDPKSSLSESYLSIRSNLAFSTDHGVPRSLMVTSTRPAEGKSTTSLALAAVLGRTGKRVLLVDADMRSPSMHQFTGQHNKMGLSNFLAGENDWQRLILKTGTTGLDLITAGPTPPSAAELLSSDRMLMLVLQLIEHYDHVVIDSPPILGLADAPLLARAVEGCVFVAEAEGVAVRGIRASLGRLTSVHAHVLGLVLTKLRHKQAGAMAMAMAMAMVARKKCREIVSSIQFNLFGQENLMCSGQEAIMCLDDVKLAVIGLGYVGLPLAAEFGKSRPVVGFDVNKLRISELQAGRDSTLELSGSEMIAAKHLRFDSDPEVLKQCNLFIVTVPTPIDAYKRPDLTPLIKASEAVGKVLKKGNVVIYESTVYPGATEEDCVPVLEKFSGLVFNEDFYVGYSPERINPGDKEHRLTNIKKVTAGSTPEAAELVDALYASIITAGTYKAPSIRVAEAAKVIENTQRDLNIALINELAIIFNKMEINTLDVLEAAGTKWNFLPFRPGLVGGHCIGVDPYYLTHKAEAIGHRAEIILAGRRLNDGMGAYVARQLIKAMLKKGIPGTGARVLMMGLTFKENCPDLRNTKVVDVISELREYGVEVDVWDPLAEHEAALHELSLELITEPLLNAYSGIVLAVAHDLFKSIGVNQIRQFGALTGHVLYDLKAIYPKASVDLTL